MNLGATLIERMIVVSILWILTWMCFPNLSDALARALWARDKANERIATIEAEVQRGPGEPPVGAVYSSPGNKGTGTSTFTGTSAYEPLIGLSSARQIQSGRPAEVNYSEQLF